MELYIFHQSIYLYVHFISLFLFIKIIFRFHLEKDYFSFQVYLKENFNFLKISNFSIVIETFFKMTYNLRKIIVSKDYNILLFGNYLLLNYYL